MGHELQDPVYNCPLVVPSPNQTVEVRALVMCYGLMLLFGAQARAGDVQDSFVLAAAAKSALMLEHFHFLGVLFGCCIRTGLCACTL